ncbi:protein kinase domain-containing protein [Rhodococcus sp. MSC1_016]|jgi:predicted ATPase/serine/threonine protein kinase/DNA-binding NarL/FixJ family response regulator|uniref:protein kinase domain-containing protein n=1 Tax=Rhodococcus sp. MSC1_016 TaxID=2909266 RepID=UPI00202DB722|nr:protein kinase [Rhodococcus sp. MSC1_016]
MADVDPFETQRDAVGPVTSELEAAGFEDAHEIGRGGFGVVFRCRQADLDRTVAVKILTSDLDEENRERFLREQRAMGRLTGHPNIVNILQVGATSSGRPYIVMPFHSRNSLDAEIRRHGPLSVEDMLKLGVKMTAALESAHRHGILHRDVKPANILLTDYGEPALTDFGIAHVSGGFETAAGIVTGSPAFTAPEVLAGRPPSRAADVYGLGATLFCALTGHAAFERRSGEQLVAQFVRITTESAPDLRNYRIADDISAVIEQTMSADPLARPSAVELGEHLREAQLRHGFPPDEMALVSEDESRRGLQLGSHRRQPSAVDPVHQFKADLPVEMTSFVGRRREVSEAKKLLEASRLVTLTGTGGVGKTRLALRVAAQAQRAFPGGVRLVGLGELRDESLLVDVVSGALGLRDQSARPIHDVLVEFLASKRILLVLDNCEQLVDAVARLVEDLLRACSELRILATSREALAISGEAVLRVPPLTVPGSERQPLVQGLAGYDAVRLFVERAASAVPGFELTEDNQDAVAGICRRLDGLPLAIELAAARLRAMSPEQILQRITDRFVLLTGGARNAPTRQQALRLCIDWSFELCTSREQLVWTRLSVFAGSFELDSAEAICGHDLDPTGVLDTVTALLDKSILLREESGQMVRFRMLETLRGYGREKSQRAGEHLELSVRHRDWYQQLAVGAETDWISSRQLEWIRRLEREQSNLREAMEFCVLENPRAGLRIATALYQFWHARSLFSEGRYWFDRLLEHDDGQPTVERVKALYGDSVFAEKQGALTVTNALVEEARALAEQAADTTMDALVAYAEGLSALFRGDLPRACALLEGSVAVYTAPKDLTLRVEALWMLGLAYGWQGDTGRSISCLDEILTITRARGESVFQGCSLWAKGVALWRQGDHQSAAVQLKEGLRLAQVANDQVGASACLETLAWIARSDDDAHRAVVLMGAAESLSGAVGSSSVYLPNLREYHNDCERKARGALRSNAFDAARKEGNMMSFTDAIAYALDERPSDGTSQVHNVPVLTKREQEVARLVAQGLTNRAIADRLVISPRTAQGHVEHILTKLGFTSRAQIAAWVVEWDAQGS